MLRLLRLIFTGDGHAHEWETMSVTGIYKGLDARPTSSVHLMKCKICGNWKRVKV